MKIPKATLQILVVLFFALQGAVLVLHPLGIAHRLVVPWTFDAALPPWVDTIFGVAYFVAAVGVYGHNKWLRVHASGLLIWSSFASALGVLDRYRTADILWLAGSMIGIVCLRLPSTVGQFHRAKARPEGTF